MNEKLQKALESILQDEAEASRFAELKTVDDMYAYFSSKVPGLSEAEFDDFIVEMMEGYAENEEAIRNIDVASLADVAGGANLGAKFASGALALLSFLPGVGAANVKKPVNSSARTSVGKKVSKAKDVKKVTPAVKKTPVVKKQAVQTPAVETPAVETPAVETPAVETPAVETPAVETPEVKTPEISNKYPKTKSWFRRHPIVTTLGTIGTAVLMLFGAKKAGLIGNKTVQPAPDAPPKLLTDSPANSHTELQGDLYDGEFRKAIDYFENATDQYLPDVPENSPREEIMLYHNAISFKNQVSDMRKQVNKVDRSRVSQDVFSRLEIELNRVEEQCDRIITATKPDVKNTDGKLEFLQQLINSREAHQEAINPYGDASDWKTDKLIKEIGRLLKSKTVANANLGALRVLYTALKNKKLSASERNELTQIDAKIEGFGLGNLYDGN